MTTGRFRNGWTGSEEDANGRLLDAVQVDPEDESWRSRSSLVAIGLHLAVQWIAGLVTFQGGEPKGLGKSEGVDDLAIEVAASRRDAAALAAVEQGSAGAWDEAAGALAEEPLAAPRAR